MNIADTQLSGADDPHSSKNGVSGIYDRLQEIYWAKKELDEFLPNIAKYAKPEDIVSITLAQLALIEKQVILTLEELSNGAAQEELRI